MATQVLDHHGRRPLPQSAGGGGKDAAGGNSGGGNSGGGNAGAAAAELNPYRWIILVGLITAAVMEVLDTTIINVALPQMAGNLNATTDEIAWVSTGYILSNVIVLPMTAWLGQRFGRKNYLVFSIGLFILASFFCGTSKTLIELVFWRILQGGGGAALLSTAQATLRQIFPKEQQGVVQTIFILGIVAAPTLGPLAGGYITDNYNWPWVFYVNIPIGLIAAFLVGTYLHDPPGGPKAGKIDVPGILLLTVGLGSSIGADHQEAFELLITWSFTFYGLAYLALFAIPIFSPRNRNLRPRLWLRVTSLFGLLSTLLFVVLSIFPVVTLENPWHYSLKIASVVIGANMLGVAAYLAGQRRTII